MTNKHKLFSEETNKKLAKFIVDSAAQAGKAHVNDSEVTNYVLRELTAKSQFDVNVLYEKLEALKFLHKEQFSLGLDAVRYEVKDSVGKAKIVDAFAKDTASTEAKKSEVVVAPWIYGANFEWSIIEEMTNDVPAIASTIADRRNSAVDKLLRALDEAAAIGNPASGVKGLINQPTTGPNAVFRETTADWTNSGTSSATIYDDLAEAIRKMSEVTLEHHKPNLVLLPSDWYTQLKIRRFSASDSVSIYKLLTETFPEVSFAPWTKLENAGQGNGKQRVALVNANNPEVMTFSHFGDMVNSLAPQNVGLSSTVHMYSKTAGIINRVPKGSVSYLDEA